MGPDVAEKGRKKKEWRIHRKGRLKNGPLLSGPNRNGQEKKRRRERERCDR